MSQIRNINVGSRVYEPFKDANVEEWRTVGQTLAKLVRYISTQEELVAQNARLDLAWQVAHDIRSPLTFLNIFASNSISINDDERETIKIATSRISNIAGELLEMRRNESYEPRILDIGLLKNDIIDLISQKRLEYSVTDKIEFDINFSTNFEIVSAAVDQSWINRILSNLLNNSLEAIQERGKISVRSGYGQGILKIEIEDSGCGISPDRLSKIQNQIIFSGKPYGNGLGLYHAKKKIESVGGSVQIVSVESQGTTVTLNIPATQLAKTELIAKI
ncbi:MAG: hypothetical protein EOP04_19235 [Proteobacteria bacterium]|nr:MAG: hypothetical protein EOP04_19235 [Pseudomonadota bacterium]